MDPGAAQPPGRSGGIIALDIAAIAAAARAAAAGSAPAAAGSAAAAGSKPSSPKRRNEVKTEFSCREFEPNFSHSSSSPSQATSDSVQKRMALPKPNATEGV